MYNFPIFEKDLWSKYTQNWVCCQKSAYVFGGVGRATEKCHRRDI